jgi:glycine cleavage system regulatory protein
MLIGLTIFAIIILISGQSTFANGIKKKITELEEKADEIEKGEIVDRQYEEIISFLPAAISIDDLRNKLTKMAVDSKVQIISF